jgi:hypothetical protein
VEQQGVVYAAFIDAALKDEQARRDSLDSRALSVLTTSSALIALVFSLTVLITGEHFVVSDRGARGIACSLGSFVVAAALGLWAHETRPYRVADIPTLRLMYTTHWTDGETTARNFCCRLSVRNTASLRTGNNRKAGILIVAFIFQIAALVGLLATLGYEFRSHLF